MAEIAFHEGKGKNGASRVFHLYNKKISYIMHIMRNGQMGHLYFGRRLRDNDDFSRLQPVRARAQAPNPIAGDDAFSLEHVRQEYPAYGASDFRQPAMELLFKDGSRVTDFRYLGHEVIDGKPSLDGLPATYAESDTEAKTLRITLADEMTGLRLELLYTIFDAHPAIARSARFVNRGKDAARLLRAMSFSLDFPNDGTAPLEWLQFSGAWAKERHIKTRPLECGVTAIGSARGHSSHEQNPFIVVKEKRATEDAGCALGLSLVYSGNFLVQAETDSQCVTRLMAGINPLGFSWKLEPGETFQTPEAVAVFSAEGLSGMSRAFHSLYRSRLARGAWRDKPRPILINNWEATYFDFTEEKLISLAKKAAECGIELFVLDDGWFGKRASDHAGLGDWRPNPERLPQGVAGLAEKINALGLAFGLWIEPEMTNRDSDLYRAHPDWVICAPGRSASESRHQLVLDFSRQEVVDAIHDMLFEVLSSANVSYVKWDMNRSITECYSRALPPDRQGEVFHRHILGVYSLYERLTREFPQALFESCAGGGGRFDAGLLYYAPQGWTSDDTDAIERLKIQYGTSFCYPLSSMGCHVSASPNHQVNRITPIGTRAAAACFGAFGYELDLTKLSKEEIEAVKAQVAFVKEYREIIQQGDFYRLKSPFEGNEAAWQAVSGDKRVSVATWFRALNAPNQPFTRLCFCGLDPNLLYTVREHPAFSASGAPGETLQAYGDELMHAGIIVNIDESGGDFAARVYALKATSL